MKSQRMTPEESLAVADLHSHLLPRVDDGSASLEESLEMLASAWRQGVRLAFATPHYCPPGYASRLPLVRERFAQLHEAAALRLPGLKLCLGQEVEDTHRRLDDMLSRGEICSLAGSRYVLVEFYVQQDARVIRESLYKALGAGIRPVLAHAERYKSLQEQPEIYGELHRRGACLQINAFSLAEEKNPLIRHTARDLVKLELADFIGSDAHRMGHRPPNLLSGVHYLRTRCGADYFRLLTWENARAVSEDRLLERLG
ncbi:MAG: hypothetical protein GX623_01115 [Clostridiales bacterium]|nr:hypothetical protein [Clostridiales bacterium]